MWGEGQDGEEFYPLLVNSETVKAVTPVFFSIQ